MPILKGIEEDSENSLIWEKNDTREIVYINDFQKPARKEYIGWAFGIWFESESGSREACERSV